MNIKESANYKIVAFADGDEEFGYRVIFYPTTETFTTRKQAADAIYKMIGIRILEK